MKTILCSICSLLICFSINGCTSTNNSKEDNFKDINNLMNQDILDTKDDEIIVYVTILNNSFIAEFKNNEIKQSLISKLPLKIKMTDLNEKEKYYI